jgi:DNA polymerase V
MILIVDVDNCFASCERKRNPDLEGKPVIVLSAGEAAVIARSNEAKKIGIKMGEPFFRMKERFRPDQYIALPADHHYYKQVSDELMAFLREECPNLYQYSIDEAFSDMAGVSVDLKQWGEQLHLKIKARIGIPVSIGIAPSKTLAKIASHFAKKYPAYRHCCLIDTDEKRVKALSLTPIEEVWGIGRRYQVRMRHEGIATAYDLAQRTRGWMKTYFPQPLVNTRDELNGIDCITMREEGPNKSVSNTRTFPQMKDTLEELATEVSNFAADCAETLRRQHTLARGLSVFVATNHYRTDLPQYDQAAAMKFETPTNLSTEIIREALALLKAIYRKGYRYKRAGVTVTSVISDRAVQTSIFDYDAEQHHKQQQLDTVMDDINRKVGRGALKLGSQVRKETSPRPSLKGERIKTGKKNEKKDNANGLLLGNRNNGRGGRSGR